MLDDCSTEFLAPPVAFYVNFHARLQSETDLTECEVKLDTLEIHASKMLASWA